MLNPNPSDLSPLCHCRMKLAKFTLRCVTFDITNTLIKVSGSVGQHYSDIAKKYVLWRLTNGDK